MMRSRQARATRENGRMKSAGKVLCVSSPDSHLLRRSRRALEAADYEVRQALDVDAALMLLLALRPIDAVVLVGVPESGAASILRALSVDSELAGVPVILAGDTGAASTAAWAQVQRPKRGLAALQALSQVCSARMV
jgi:hypothetical protein